MNGTKYANAVGAVRAMENTLLGKSDMDQLINARSKAEVNSIIASKNGGGAKSEDLEDVWNMLREYAPDCKELEILLYRNDFHNLKAVLKAIISNRDPQQYYISPSNVELSVLTEAINSKEYDALPEYMRDAAAEAYELVTRTLDGQLSDSFEGRQITPGHAIEAMWFIMDLGKRLGRLDLIEKAKNTTLTMLDYGWDKEFGGIYYFMDRKGCPPQQLEWDQKLWWVHIETLISLLKGYHLTGDQQCLEWFNKVHDYTWTHFKDTEHPEWFGYLNRRGEVLLPLKGGKWKGCFHVPRGLYQCWTVLEEIANS